MTSREGPAREALAAAVDVLSEARRILVFTGAGISTESGIPDFRGPNGLWTRVDPEDFTIQRYRLSRSVRVEGWRMHQNGELWGARSDIHPNRAHIALTELWRAGRMSGTVTQNIDGLHQAAGLPDSVVAELHGNIRKTHCLSCHERWDTEVVLEWVDAGMHDPHCPNCGGLVKTTTVMFGEYLPDSEMTKAFGFASDSDAVLVIGSTLSVYPAAEIPLSVAAGGAPLVIVNLGPTDHDRVAAVKIEHSAGEAVPLLVASLSG